MTKMPDQINSSLALQDYIDNKLNKFVQQLAFAPAMCRPKHLRQLLSLVLGQLFVGAAGIPFLITQCDYHAYKSFRAPRVTTEYWFPLGVF